MTLKEVSADANSEKHVNFPEVTPFKIIKKLYYSTYFIQFHCIKNINSTKLFAT